MSERATVARASPTDSPAVIDAPEPYVPSWIHPLSDAIDRLPCPRWVACAGIAVLGIFLQHAQLWSTGRVEVGAVDRINTYWGLMIALAL